MLAAGGSVEPFWGLYQQHRKPEVLEILEPYRIGTLEGGGGLGSGWGEKADVRAELCVKEDVGRLLDVG